jgi:hypothetical protein
MNMNRALSVIVAIAYVSTCTVSAQTPAGQTFSDVQIRLGPYEMNPDGGERPLNMWRSTGAVVIGQTTHSGFSWAEKSCEAWGVSAKVNDFRDDATVGWNIELTPLRVVGDAVTFRLRWVRFEIGKRRTEQFSFDAPAGNANREDIELTLRPGESAPLETMPVPEGATTVHGRRCGSSVSIRVSVDPYPWEGEEHRLVGADLWLVERLANGSEVQRSQPLTLRGIPNHAVSFYFDRFSEANMFLDVYGVLTPRLTGNAIEMAVVSRCRWKEPPTSGRVGPQYSVKSQVRINASEIVEVQLPPFAKEAGPFANRTFSIRIRARQLR